MLSNAMLFLMVVFVLGASVTQAAPTQKLSSVANGSLPIEVQESKIGSLGCSVQVLCHSDMECFKVKNCNFRCKMGQCISDPNTNQDPFPHNSPWGPDRTFPDDLFTHDVTEMDKIINVDIGITMTIFIIIVVIACGVPCIVAAIIGICFCFGCCCFATSTRTQGRVMTSNGNNSNAIYPKQTQQSTQVYLKQ